MPLLAVEGGGLLTTDMSRKGLLAIEETVAIARGNLDCIPETDGRTSAVTDGSDCGRETLRHCPAPVKAAVAAL